MTRLYPYRRVAAQDSDTSIRHPVVVVGAGPVGLTLALDLGLRGTPVLLLDKRDGSGEGSRAICFARHTLEIAYRLGCGQRMADKGVVWQTGRVFHGDRQVFAFDLSPDGGYRMPAFVNLQQPYVEQYLVEAIREARDLGAPIEIRGGNRVNDIERSADGVHLTVTTPDGDYRLDADWLVACDGARSPVRGMLGLGFEGRVFEDNFLIADIRMRAGFPAERRFWFEPVFGRGTQSALLHKQPDDIWRLDFQLGWDIDRDAELADDAVRARVDAMLGDKVDYNLEWTSIYTFQCRRMSAFRHSRVLFAGDAAHQVSPFGARGANSGMQDADNLGWKLDLVTRGLAPDTLLDRYTSEREAAADENILASTRSTDFLTPKSTISRIFRDAVLELAHDHAFARPMVNSGRLSVPTTYPADSGADALLALGAPVETRPGAPCPDVPVPDSSVCDARLPESTLLSATRTDPVPAHRDSSDTRTCGRHLIDLLGRDFSLLAIDRPVPGDFIANGVRVSTLALLSNHHPASAIRSRYLGTAPGGIYLIRPDRHIVARWERFDAVTVLDALATATNQT